MADGTSASPAPYLVVADTMRARIADGTWPPGHRLPSRSALGRDFGGAGENVVRRAQELLIDEGLLEGRAGSGTYVRATRQRHTLWRTQEAGSVNNTAAPAGFAGTWEADSEAKVPAPPVVAGRLGIEEGAHCVRTVYEFLLQHRPVLLLTSWEPMAITGGSVIVLPEGGPLAGRGVPARMGHIGVEVTRVREVPRPVQVDREQAHLLGAPVGSRATLIERTHYDASGRAVETADLLAPANQWEIAYDIPVAPSRP
ncbi:GntR family transcriptional regulator [Streptomyces sp. SID12501]|uniref:GntR family transcriptional regulator n=1 Tax=Streptomyces sp. SID12501 TaxID=2706042 RepID=A0A6B3BUK8_9ACTN|nr:GntR family transcriptional regulator [Streptomyces sp. SID12501]NEC88071.1 GntR family transcriptional regulator [Streptomyces sp. SID12501]